MSPQSRAQTLWLYGPKESTPSHPAGNSLPWKTPGSQILWLELVAAGLAVIISPSQQSGREGGQDQNHPQHPQCKQGSAFVPMTLSSTTGHCTMSLLKIKLLFKHSVFSLFLLPYERLSASSVFFLFFCHILL